MPPYTDPHRAGGYSWTCPTCDPPVVLTAATEAELTALVDDHNATVHPA